MKRDTMENPKISIMIRVERDTIKALDKIADRGKTTRSAIIRVAVEELIERVTMSG